MTYHSFKNVTMVLLTHLVTSSFVLQALLFFGTVECNNSNEIQMISPPRDCREEFDDCQEEGGSEGRVCGMDGQSYRSACRLFYQSCINGNNNRVGYNGDCQYQYVDNEAPAVGRKQSLDDDDDDEDTVEDKSNSSSSSSSTSSEEPTEGDQDGSGSTVQPGGDPEDDSDEDVMTTPKPKPPPTLPSKPAPMYCVDKPGCRVQPEKPPKFEIEFPICPNYKKCSSRNIWETDTIPPKIPGTGAPPVQSSLPMGTRIAVAFFSIVLASMLAVVGFRLYSSRNRRASDESRNQIEMTSTTSGRSGSVQTYTSVA